MSFERRNVTANVGSLAVGPWPANRQYHSATNRAGASPVRDLSPTPSARMARARKPSSRGRAAPPTPVPSRQGRPIHYANVCTITGPATAVAGPVSRGARFCSYPCQPAFIGFLGTRVIVEDADRRHRVVRRVDHVIGPEAWHIADDRDSSLLDPAGQLFGHAGLCLALTDGCVHRSSPLTSGPTGV